MEIDTILFDLHHTLTATKDSVLSVVRKAALKGGIDLSEFSDDDLNEAFTKVDMVMQKQLVSRNVDPLWGGKAEEWVPFDKIHLQQLGIDSFSDEDILKFEMAFKRITTNTDWEYFTDDASLTVSKLHEMGYKLGICTRRTDDPTPLLERHNLLDKFSTVQWSGVRGYAKPNPYTLIIAAKELHVNPRRCLFVGNYVNADVEAALRCEMKPVLLTWANPEEKEKAPPECLVFDQPSEILKWLQSSRASS